ncbi:MAG: MerR family transcriptional regulator [Gemmatimonadaceae bacterium]
MPATPEDLDIQQLAERAGVTVRTIRYYIQQGLLPAPDSHGPATRYGAAHLDRLHLIRRLQREHLPLAEIRRRLEVLRDADVRRVLSEAPAKKHSRSAAEYVREVLSRDRRRESGQSPLASFSHASLANPVSELSVHLPHETQIAEPRASALSELLGAGQREPRQPGPHTESRSTWERIGLGNDIELHVRRPLSREQNRQLEQLLRAARDLLTEDA